MAQKRSGIFFRGVSAIARYLDLVRRILANVLFLGVIILVLLALRGDFAPEVPDGGALVLAPRGELVEEYQGDGGQALGRILGAETNQTRVRDLVVALEEAAGDDRIKAAVLDLSRMTGGQFSKLQDVARAMRHFRDSGKKLYAWAGTLDQARYYLAAQADEVYMHPMGTVLIQGFGVYQKYFKELLASIELDVNVFRVGEYKSAVEPYIRNDMSQAARRANGEWLNDLWGAYKRGVAQARGLQPEAVQRYVDQYPELLAAQGGDTAALAVDQGLIDGLLSRDQLRDKLKGLVGASAEEEDAGYRRIVHGDYLLAQDRATLPTDESARVGVIVASGAIVDGENVPGAIASETTAKLIRRAREDEGIKALVLRVDSPGGSAYGSEVIRRELALTRQAGKPVVVSMGSVAASGGYWISLAADEIWASPTTLTGSIGVFGLLPTYQDTQARLGIHTDGVGTTRYAGALRLDRELQPGVARSVQMMVENTYDSFIEKVAQGRKMAPEKVREIAQGRVWSGADAAELGLVDHLGGLKPAMDSAARLAGLDPETYSHRHILPPTSFAERLLAQLGQGARAQLRAWLPSWARVALSGVQAPLSRLVGTDPSGVYAYCACRPQ